MTAMVVPCEVYSRVVGYFRPVHNWNEGKRQEFAERIEFTEKDSLEKQQGVSVVCSSRYKIFTFPNCDKCEQVKSHMKEQGIDFDVVNLKSPEGNSEFRNYYKEVKDKIERSDDGTIKLPVVMAIENGKVVSTSQGLEAIKVVA